jgi:hypothetical protein
MSILTNQLFIEGENNRLYVYVYLNEFKKTNASKILDNYIDTFRGLDFEKIYVSFWNKGVPGEHLSTFRKTSNRAIGKILKGMKYIDSYFDFKENLKVINSPRLVN